MHSFVHKLRNAALAVRLINCTSSYFIANIINHNIPITEKVSAVFGSLQITTTWLLAVESEHAEVLLTAVYNS